MLISKSPDQLAREDLIRQTLAVPDVIEQFRSYNRANPCWGVLHVVLDDGNWADNHVDFCIGYAIEREDAEGEALARILRKMSRTQRRKISRMAGGAWLEGAKLK